MFCCPPSLSNEEKKDVAFTRVLLFTVLLSALFHRSALRTLLSPRPHRINLSPRTPASAARCR